VGFSIRAPLAPTGGEEELDTSDLAYEPGMMTVPKRYKLRFIPVNEEREGDAGGMGDCEERGFLSW
jgi:hypothetical protein